MREIISNIKFLIVIVFLSFSFNNKVYTQNEELLFKNISIEDGLSQSTVFASLQDSRGFIWLGTNTGGVNRFDGYSFVVYMADRMDTCGISGNIISKIYEDSKGFIWIGTRNFGLNRYNYDTDCFVKYYNDNTNKNSIPDNVINDIYEDENGTLWVATRLGLCFYNYKKDEFINVINRDTGIGLGHISTICSAGPNLLLLGTKLGLQILNTKKNTIIENFTHSNSIHSLSENIISCVLTDKKGRVWVGTRHNGLNMAKSIRSGIFTRYLASPKDKNSISNNIIRTLHEDGNGDIWIGTKDGLNKLTTDEQKSSNPIFIHYRSNINEQNSLSNNSIYSFLEDKNGNFWIGAWGGGVDILNISNIKFSHYSHKKNNANSLSSNEVSSFAEDKYGLWIGTESGGLNLLNRKEKHFQYYTHNINNSNSLISNHIKALLIDSDNDLWIGSYKGLQLFDREENKFSLFLKGSIVYSIEEGIDDNIWVGTSSGLFRLVKSNKTIVAYLSPLLRDSTSLSDQFIHKVFKDRNDNIWVGTKVGLNLYNRKDDNFIHFFYSKDDFNSISNNFVTSICEDSEGVLWIGTLDGLNMFDPVAKSFIMFNKKSGLPDNAISNMMADDNGDLWITTNRGLSRFNPRLPNNSEDIVRNYDTDDGLQSREFILNASYKSKRGELFFGGNNGFNAFYPDSVKEEEFNPKIIISDFKLFNKSVKIGAKGSLLTKHISNTDLITLKYNQSVIGIEYVAFNFLSPEKIKYSYKMDGFDDKWNFVGNKREATYTNLSAGEYIFRVKASNSLGLWSNNQASVKIVVLPAWWKTWWVKGGGIVFIILVVIGVYYYRVKALENQKRILERSVGERTIELQEANDELEEKHNEILHQKDEITEQKNRIEKAYEDIELLSKIGTEINMSLSIESIIDMSYKSLLSIMEVPLFSVGLFNEKSNALVFRGSKGVDGTYHEYTFNLNEINRLGVWCFKNQKPVLIKDLEKEYATYIDKIIPPEVGDAPRSIIYLPLNVKDKRIGVISAQSPKINVYNEYHQNILKSIGIYAAIALDNADAYNKIENQAKSLVLVNKQLEEKQEEIQNQYAVLSTSEEQMSGLNEELYNLNEQLLSQRDELESTIAQLKSAQSKLVHAEKMASVGVLTAGVAHEINNPLNFIQGGKSAIASYIEENLQEHAEELEPLIEIINDGVKRASNIVSSLNRFNRKSEIYSEECDMHLIIDNCLTILHNELKHKVEVHKDYTNKDVRIIGNEGELHQLVINLLSNAEQAIEERGSVDIKTQVLKKKFKIIIQDTGCGIDKEYLKRITEPFFTTKDPGKGTGLGLSIGYSIVEKHKGEIKFESKKGDGTKVTVTLPIRS